MRLPIEIIRHICRKFFLELFDDRVIMLDGDKIAAEILKLPITNTIMLGALAAVSDEISLADIENAIRLNMPEKLQTKNIAAVRAAAEVVRK